MLWRTFGTSSNYQGEYVPPSPIMPRRLSLVLRAAPKGFGWQSSGRKERFIVWHSMKAAIPTSKLTLDCCIIALRLLDWLCFCNKNIGFNRLKAPLRQCSTSTCCTFSFTFLLGDSVSRSHAQTLLYAVYSRQWSEVTRMTKHSSCAHHAQTIILAHHLA